MMFVGGTLAGGGCLLVDLEVVVSMQVDWGQSGKREDFELMMGHWFEV